MSQTQETPGEVVKVEVNQQQEVALHALLEEGTFGSTEVEVLQNVFRQFLRQTRF